MRVIERRETHRILFPEAQKEIKSKLELKKRGEAIREYVAELGKRTPVWTIYDDENESSRLAKTPRDG